MKKYLYLAAALLTMSVTACNETPNDNDNDNNVKPAAVSSCAYVLSQGNMYAGVPGILSVADYATGESQTGVFTAANGRSIGDTPQCGVAYGDKIYVGNYGSNTIEIFDINTYKSIKQIKLDDNDGVPGIMPRSMVVADGKVYIAMYDGYVARLDTVNCTIDRSVKVGANPDVMTLHRGKLYVPNTNGMDYPNYDNTYSVVDLDSFTVTTTKTTGLNPTHMYSVGGELFALCMGNYADVDAALYHIDAAGNSTKVCPATLVGASDTDLYIVNEPYSYDGTIAPDYRVYNVASATLSPWEIIRPQYAQQIAVDPVRGTILIASMVYDGQWPSYVLPGYLAEYDAQGKIKNKYEIGAGTACIFFRQK